MAREVTTDQDYNYEDAGFNDFLSRSVDTGQTGSAPYQNRQVNFEQSQISGALGDVFKVGKISINGDVGNITVNDGQNDRVVIGLIPGS